MLSWPDFAEKQIVYISSGELKSLSAINNNLVVKENGEFVNQIPLAKLFAVFVVGEATFTSVLIKKILKNGVIILFMNHNLRPYCTLGGETEGNFLLRKKQYFASDAVKKVKTLVINKIKNQLALLRKIREKDDEIRGAILTLEQLMLKVENAEDAKSVLGFEGTAAKVFFGAYFGKFKWYGRKPRTKFDEKNMLLDIGYTFLFNFIEANVRLYGFDLYCGFYHTEFYQRKSLICDLMEPFRCIIDQTLYRMLALKTFNEADFKVRNGEYHLKAGMGSKYVKEFLEAIMKKKEEIFKYVQSYYRLTVNGKDELPEFNPF